MNLKWGVVEDINDPLESGRVRVRVFGVHSEKKTEVPTEALPWAQCMTGAYDSALGGVGNSPTGIQTGQLVALIFLDKMMQTPFILGAVAGINTEILSCCESMPYLLAKNNNKNHI